MANVLKVSEAASLALHAMVLLAARDEVVSTGEIASTLRVSVAHLSKVLQRLARVGLVRSIRGPKGGFILGKASEEITLLDVYEAIEGPLVPSNCLLNTPVCSGERCILGGLLETVNEQVREYLAGTRLSELDNVYHKSGGYRQHGLQQQSKERGG